MNPQESANEAGRILAREPGNAAAMLQLADALMDLGETVRALATYHQALALRTPFPEAHHNLAVAHLQLGNYDQAIAECRRAIAERPIYALALNTLGAALGKAGRTEEAVAAFHKAIEFQPGYAKAYHNLGNVLDQMGRGPEARDAYRTALAIHPNLEEARYDLAALGEGQPPPGTPRSYLVRLFDTYARSFNHHLVEKLDYHVPEMLYECVIALNPGTALEVIDLGCGTGLVGKLFRPLASRLTGVDVSPGMIRQAERLHIYDHLILDDIANYLNARKNPCDLVLAADVFIYMGDLTATFQAVSRLLRPGGLFAFSLELTGQGDYLLQPNRRYAQSLNYIDRLAVQHGLEVVVSKPVSLRRQGTGDAEGGIVVLRKQ
jgi:predicted TPR repeat methyltransferase